MEKDISYEKESSKQSFTSYIISIFNRYLDNASTDTSKPTTNTYIKNGGLMPHSPPRKTDAFTSTQTVTAPISIVSHQGDDDHWDYLSTSDTSSTSSMGSSFSSVSDQPSRKQRRSISSLSEILCEHYVKKALNSNHQDSIISIETDMTSNDWCGSRENTREETKEWAQVVDEEIFLPKEEVTTEIILVEQPHLKKARGVRSNPAHLRMIVLEVNMMRCDKIVGPLKPRGFLRARSDPFVPHRISSLQSSITAF